ncbi:hypothetical protein ASZ90_004644 [hydrocarbon metagenome]|uniref:Uncharacterized protein n=1 Tax=hydrocarbon metagenome TaxID=938273 RepID=A0A0W8FXE0_9ZZZZ
MFRKKRLFKAAFEFEKTGRLAVNAPIKPLPPLSSISSVAL